MPHGYASQKEAVGKAVKDLELDFCLMCSAGEICDMRKYVSGLEVLI